jgi:hypothetical protein
MLSGLDLGRAMIIIDDVALRLLKAKEDALTVTAGLSILKYLALLLLVSIKSKEAAAKDAKVSHVRHFPRLDLVGRVLATGVGHHVVEPKEVMEGKGPELRLKTSASQHGTEGVLDGPVGTLTRAVGGRGIGSRGFNGVASTLKQFIHFSRAAQLTQIPSHILASTIGTLGVSREAKADQPAVQEVDGRAFGREGVAPEHA